MNCESRELQIRELLRGRLEESVANDVREHLNRCESCRRRYEELSASAGPDVRISEIDSPKSGTNNAGVEQARQIPERTRLKYTALWPSSIALVGRFAMGRQVAAAAVMLVVVAVGLWYVPQIRHRPEAVGSSITHPDFASGASASGSLEPAEPLDLAIDRRSGRIHEKGAEPAFLNNYRRGVQALSGEKPAVDGNVQPAAIDGGIGEQGAVVDSGKAQTADRDPGAAPEQAQEPAIDAKPEALSNARPSLPTKHEVESPLTIYRRALNSYRAGRYEEALKDLNEVLNRPDARQLHRKALLYLGRSYRTSSHCTLAIQQYKTLITRFGGTPEAGDAMVEAAMCYRQMREPAKANELMENASHQHWLTPRARDELKRLGY